MQSSSSRRLILQICFLVAISVVVRVLAAAQLKADDNARANSAANGSSLRATGIAMLEQLPKIAFGTKNELFLVAQRDGKSVACSRSSLITTGAGPTLRYKYHDVSILRAKGYDVLEVQTTGIFTKEFHPDRIDWEIIEQASTGEYKTTKESLVAVGKEFVFTRVTPDSKETTNRFAKPSAPYAYFTPYLMELLPLENGQRFILNNLDAETGTLQADSYIVTDRTKGGLRVSKKTLPAKLETEFFFLSASQQVETHGLTKLDLKFETSTEPIVLAMENAFRRRRKD